MSENKWLQELNEILEEDWGYIADLELGKFESEKEEGKFFKKVGDVTTAEGSVWRFQMRTIVKAPDGKYYAFAWERDKNESEDYYYGDGFFEVTPKKKIIEQVEWVEA